jgi:hypothetical protein
MDFVFKTQFVLVWTIIWGVIYMIALFLQNRSKDINLPDFMGAAFASASLIGGLKLMYNTYNYVIPLDKGIDMDHVYTAYGGLCVVWLSVRNYWGKCKK